MSLPDRDPAVDVTLTPDAERITARVDGWMREVRDRAERGQLKYPPWHTATTPRNAGREGVEEALDLLWYLSAAEDQIATLRARIADLERERDRMRPVFEVVREWATYCNSPSKQLHYTDRLLAALEAATQEARHD